MQATIEGPKARCMKKAEGQTNAVVMQMTTVRTMTPKTTAEHGQAEAEDTPCVGQQQLISLAQGTSRSLFMMTSLAVLALPVWRPLPVSAG